MKSKGLTIHFVAPPEVVIDSLSSLSRHRASPPQIPSKVTCLFYELIRHLEIPGPQVPRIACHLFCKFLPKHLSDVIYQVQRDSDFSWDGTETNLKNQILLRVVTCITIACKYDNRYPSYIQVSEQVLYLMGKLSNASYTIRSLKKSEIRVLETVKWNIEANSVADSVHILYSVMRLNDMTVKRPGFASVIHHLLDLFEMCWNSMVSGVAMNAIYMSAVVISASAYITCGPYKSKKVTEELTFITRFRSRDIFENRDSLLLILCSPLTL